MLHFKHFKKWVVSPHSFTHTQKKHKTTTQHFSYHSSQNLFIAYNIYPATKSRPLPICQPILVSHTELPLSFTCHTTPTLFHIWRYLNIVQIKGWGGEYSKQSWPISKPTEATCSGRRLPGRCPLACNAPPTSWTGRGSERSRGTVMEATLGMCAQCVLLLHTNNPTLLANKKFVESKFAQVF